MAENTLSQYYTITRILYETLSTVNRGDIISYDALSEVIGKDVRKYAFSSLSYALKKQLRDKRIFECIRNEGYKLLTSAEIIKTQASKGLEHISKVAVSTAIKIASVDFNSLTNEECISHNAQISAFGAIVYMTRPSSLSLLEQRIAKTNTELPIGDTLKLMSGDQL